jgi:uncharacterized protein YacL
MSDKTSHELFVIFGGAIVILLPILFFKLMMKHSGVKREKSYATLLGSLMPSMALYFLYIPLVIFSKERNILEEIFITTIFGLVFYIIGLLSGVVVSIFTKNVKRSTAVMFGAFIPTILWALFFLLMLTSDI